MIDNKTVMQQALPTVGYYGLNQNGYEVIALKAHNVLYMFDPDEITAQPVCLISDALNAIAAIAQPVEPAADKLLQIIAATYQIAGACDLPVHILGVLANPERATQEQIDAMLPFVQPTAECNFCPRCGKRLGSADDIHTCTAQVDPKETK